MRLASGANSRLCEVILQGNTSASQSSSCNTGEKKIEIFFFFLLREPKASSL